MTAPRHRSKVGRAVTRYRHARRLLRTPASLQSRAGLDWTNFFIADVQTGFGTFVAFYLADLGWSQSNVGLVLGSGGIAGVLSLVPGGALADALPWKRALVAAGALMICGAALIFALAPTFPLVFVAEILHGSTAGIMTPAIAAISLGLVGRRAMSLRTGRNFGFSGAGTAVTAGVLGAIGSFVAPRAIFLAAAALCAPALIALSRIRPEEIDHARARNAPTGDAKLHRLIDLAKNRNLVAFAGCLMLFQFANASMLPLLGETFGATKAAHGAILISALIIGPQVVVAVMAPSVGYLSEVRGRKPVLMVGFSLEVVRAVLFAFVTNTEAVIAIELLDGVTGSIFNVMTVLIITDLTAGTGRFNLVQGVIGALLAIAAALSTGLSGFLFQGFGRAAGFLAIAAIAAGATAAAWMLLPETKPQRYADH